MLKACLLVGAAQPRIDLIIVGMEARYVGGMMLALLERVLHLRLQHLRQAIAPQLDPSVLWTTIAAVAAAQARERTPSYASNASNKYGQLAVNYSRK